MNHCLLHDTIHLVTVRTKSCTLELWKRESLKKAHYFISVSCFVRFEEAVPLVFLKIYDPFLLRWRVYPDIRNSSVNLTSYHPPRTESQATEVFVQNPLTRNNFITKSLLHAQKGHVKIILLLVIALSYPFFCSKLEQTLHKQQEQHS